MRVRPLLALCVLLLPACREAPVTHYPPGVPLDLARHRAATISDLRYDLALSVPALADQPIHGSERIDFRFEGGGPVVLDFAQPATHVQSVAANGAEVSAAIADEHIVIPADALREGPNTVELRFIAGDGSLNRNDEFLYALFVPDRARVAIPVFDQPDLRGTLRLRLEVPAEWQAATTAPLVEHTVDGERAVFQFGESESLPSYLFNFVAGRFEVEQAERGARTLRMFHRETDGAKLARNREAIFDLHAAALDWLEDYTGIPYPFSKFDFVLIPSFQYGGMEHPGAILYRADRLLLDESATQNQVLGRAGLISHETAHMWFGDLVTLEWFNDVWMKEVFAGFMAAKIVNPSFPELDHELRFLTDHYPQAYEVDRTLGANPIRQELDNLNEAGTLYGAIIYEKAPIVMRQLERLMGEESFRDGVREYLDQNRFGSAGWPRLIGALDPRSAEDLAAWSRVWVETPGRPTVRSRVALEDGIIDAVEIEQKDPDGAGTLWNQRLALLLGYADGGTRSFPVQLKEARHPVVEAVGQPAPDYVLANGTGAGYGYFELDQASRDFLLEHLPRLGSARLRAVAWLSLWEAMLEHRVAPTELTELALAALAREDESLNVELVLDYLQRTYWRFLTVEQREGVAGAVEELLWELLERTPQRALKASYFAAYHRMALTPAAVERLLAVWREERRIEGLPLSERDFSTLAQELALRVGAAGADLLQTQLERIESADDRARFEFSIPALSSDAEVRDAFFAGLRDPARRTHEPWVLDGLGFLNHPLRAEQAERYLRPALEMLEEIQRTGDIFFPKGWLDATLGGHGSPAAAAVVREFLAQRPDLPPRLRAKLLQSADPLFRAAEIRGTVSGSFGDSNRNSSTHVH